MTMPSISVLMAYRDRAALLCRTLASWVHWYGPTVPGVELVLIDDTSVASVAVVRDVVDAVPWDCPPRVERVDREGAHNPGVLYNQAATMATAPLLALTNPENLHLGPCFTHARETWQPNDYLVYGCRSLTPDAERQAVQTLIADPAPWTEGQWYQHSAHANRHLHFCSVIAASDFQQVGGFDLAYEHGQGYEDDDLVERIHETSMTVRTFDDPAVAHQAHGGRLTAEAQQQNSGVFMARWGHSPRTGW